MENKVKNRIKELVPEVMRLPPYPYNPDAAKAIVALEKLANHSLWNKELEITASLYIENYRQQQASDYRAMLEGRYEGSPLTLAVILQAINKLDEYGRLLVKGYIVGDRINSHAAAILDIVSVWSLADDNFDHQSPETQAFIGELLGNK